MNKKIVFLFPGQGEQRVGMGKDFKDHYPSAKACFEKADLLLKRKLSEVIWQGPDTLLNETHNSQTAVFINSMAVLSALKSQYPDLKPFACAGHSLGEYNALCAAEKLEWEEALLLVEKRAAFMRQCCEAQPGKMVAVLGLSLEELEKIVKILALPEDLWIANYNCPGQVVISGTERGIAEAVDKIKASGKKAIELKVQGAFHSGLMQPAQDQLKPFIDKAHLFDSSVHLVMNATGAFVEEPEQIKKYMCAQITHPVYWQQGIQFLEQFHPDFYIEIGSSQLLKNLNKRIPTQVPTISIARVEDLDMLKKQLNY